MDHNKILGVVLLILIIKNILLDIGEYMYRDVSVLDKEINFFCCLISIDKVLNY